VAHQQSLAAAILVGLCRGAPDAQLRIRIGHSATRWRFGLAREAGVMQGCVDFELEAPAYLALQ
jgi:hypothetical protein